MSETKQIPVYLEKFIKDHLVPVGLTGHEPKGNDLVVWNPEFPSIRFEVNYIMEREPTEDHPSNFTLDTTLRRDDMTIFLFTRIWETYTPCWKTTYDTLLDLMRPAVHVTEWIRTTDYRLNLPEEIVSFQKVENIYDWTVRTDQDCPGCPCKWLNFYYWDRYLIDCTVEGSTTVRFSRPMNGKPYDSKTSRQFLDDIRAWCADKDNELMKFYRRCVSMP